MMSSRLNWMRQIRNKEAGMIKMVKGTYGLKTNKGVEAMTKHSAPFSLPEKREEALIRAGVAVKVEQEPPKRRKKAGKEAANELQGAGENRSGAGVPEL